MLCQLRKESATQKNEGKKAVSEIFESTSQANKCTSIPLNIINHKTNSKTIHQVITEVMMNVNRYSLPDISGDLH